MLNVLIVDDTKSVHAFIKALLGKLPGTVFTSVYNGQEAVNLLTLKQSHFDVILLDWEMPILNGPDTFEAFKKNGITIPVIMTTTKNDASDIERMLSAGVAEYMLKPFTLDIVIQKIEMVTGRTLPHAA